MDPLPPSELQRPQQHGGGSVSIPRAYDVTEKVHERYAHSAVEKGGPGDRRNPDRTRQAVCPMIARSLRVARMPKFCALLERVKKSALKPVPERNERERWGPPRRSVRRSSCPSGRLRVRHSLESAKTPAIRRYRRSSTGKSFSKGPSSSFPSGVTSSRLGNGSSMWSSCPFDRPSRSGSRDPRRGWTSLESRR